MGMSHGSPVNKLNHFDLVVKLLKWFLDSGNELAKMGVSVKTNCSRDSNLREWTETGVPTENHPAITGLTSKMTILGWLGVSTERERELDAMW